MTWLGGHSQDEVKLLQFVYSLNFGYLMDYCQIRTGKLNANFSLKNGRYPFFTCGEETLLIDNYEFDTDAIILSGNGNIGIIKKYCGKFNAYQRTYVLDKFKNFDKNFLYFWFKAKFKNYISSHIKKASVPYITLSILQKFSLPIISIEKQIRIANILEKFEKLCNDSEQGLLAEIELRQKQYEYYRDKLLTFNKSK
ncbi:restriction endonuclease subunit S [Metamycoplasma equirhinis]|uniref:restriction endonuclease subunit S n=1 Tax=Metamycoplasma equirhinis TaxID=92402 RepID=UPI0035948D1E